MAVKVEREIERGVHGFGLMGIPRVCIRAVWEPQLPHRLEYKVTGKLTGLG